MAKLKGGLIQMGLKGDTAASPEEIRQAMLGAHLPPVEEAGLQGVQVLCIQEVFTQPYFVNPRGQIEAIASRDKDELPVHEMDMDLLRQIRNKWQFFRGRWPETYGPLAEIGR